MLSSDRQITRALRNVGPQPGALVIGGDYQGLAIARSLGRRGIDVVVLDDERSVSRYSRYVTASLKVADIRDEQSAVETLLDLGPALWLR